jgi:hypothetical protein
MLRFLKQQFFSVTFIYEDLKITVIGKPYTDIYVYILVYCDSFSTPFVIRSFVEENLLEPFFSE